MDAPTSGTNRGGRGRDQDFKATTKFYSNPVPPSTLGRRSGRHTSAEPLAFQITVLESTDQPINKRVELKADGTLEKEGYRSAYLFKRHLSAPISTIEDLAAELERIQADPYQCIVMGKPCGPIPLDQPARRLKIAREEDGAPATLEDQMVGFLPIDLDGLIIADLDVIGDPEAAVEAAIKRLGPEFDDVSCWWQLSSGQKPTGHELRLRLFFVLDQPLDLSDLKSWGGALSDGDYDHDGGCWRRAPVEIDPCIYRAAQPIYTATPTFVTGRDHLPRRSGLLLREHDTVALNIPAQTASKPYTQGDASGTVKGAEGYLEAIGDHPGGNGFHNAITPTIMSLVNRQWPDVSAEAIKAVIRQAVQQADRSKHTDREVQHRQSDVYLDPSIRDAIKKVEQGLLEKYPDQSIQQIAERIRQYRKAPPQETPSMDVYANDYESGRYDQSQQPKGNGKDHQGHQPSTTWEEPEELPEIRPPVIAFDPEMLPEALRNWIMDIADRMQCPPDFPAVGAMVALASLVGRKIGIRPKRMDDWLETTNLWGGVIGRPGVLKSPALAEALRPLNRLAAAAREDQQSSLESWEAEKIKRELDEKALKADATKAAKGKDRDKVDLLVDQLRRLKVEEEAGAPPERRYITNDSTIEKLGELLANNPNGMLVFRDELTGWLKQLDKDGWESARAFYLEAWAGKGSFTFDRIGRGTIHIDCVCLSILGGIQPGPLLDYTRAAASNGRGADGLLQRFQMLVWPDDPGRWKNVDRWPNSEARNRAFGMFQYLDSLIPVSIGAQQDEPEDIPYLRFSNEAQHLFDEWRAELEDKLRGDLPEVIESHLAKYRKLCPTLALLIHLADGGMGSVSEAAMIKAAAWCEYLESHANRVYAAALQPDITAAHALAKKIEQGALDNPFKAKDVYRNHWRGLDREQTDKAIVTLEELDWLQIMRIDTGGRPSQICYINPALYGGGS